MKLFAHFLSWLGGGLEFGLRAGASLLRILYFVIQAVLFQPEGASSLLCSDARLNLSMQVFTSLLGPLLSYKNLLSDLYGSNGKLIKRK